MPDTEPQSTQSEETTPLAEEPQTPTPAPEPSPSEQPSVSETKPAEPAPAPVEPPPTLDTPAPVEPPSTPTEPQSAPSITDNQPPTTDNLQTTDNKPLTAYTVPYAQTPQSQPSEPAQPSPSQIFSLKNLGGQDSRSFLLRAREKIQFRKKAKLEKIITLAQKKRSIANDDVEKLLRVSDATATRYLAELVRQGRLKRSGVRGSAKYEPI